MTTLINDSTRNKADTIQTWEKKRAFRIHLLITKDEEDSFSAIALNLPGAGSCGDTEEEAETNAKEAILGAIESYDASGAPIPWDNTEREIPFGANVKWIIVYA